MMKPLLQLITLAGGIFACSLTSAQTDSQSQSLPQSQSAGKPANKAEARQLTQDMSPKGRAKLSKREANAAYREALAACKSMSAADKKQCRSEAKTNLNNDLAFADDIKNSGTSVGSSASGTTASGAGGATGAASSTAQSNESQSNSRSSEPATKVEKQQMTEDFSPKARYNRSRREANAAYSEALKECKSMPKSDRAACNKEARDNLQNDLTHAKSQMQQGRSSESSGSNGGGSGGSRSGGASGM